MDTSKKTLTMNDAERTQMILVPVLLLMLFVLAVMLNEQRLLDKYAGMAMQGKVANSGYSMWASNPKCEKDYIREIEFDAKRAYDLAGGMVKAKRPQRVLGYVALAVILSIGWGVCCLSKINKQRSKKCRLETETTAEVGK